MNLEDLLAEVGLQQDEWSLTAPTFGKTGQIEVIGWSGRLHLIKYYVVKCAVCSQDPELFGGGYFKVLKANLINGAIPCGCSVKPHWSLGQYTIICTRKAQQLGCEFLGFEEDRCGARTKIRILCKKHGELVIDMDYLFSKGKACEKCKIESMPTEKMTTAFFESGAFHPDTKFWRSGRRTKRGRRAYWHMYCPDCGEQGEALAGDLRRGKKPCACSRHRQQECYINWIVDDKFEVVALKFGIANNSKLRVQQQNRQSIYSVIQYRVYVFPDIASCKVAERSCKQQVVCGILTKNEMPDGYTETTEVGNLLKIIEIYELNGGVSEK